MTIPSISGTSRVSVTTAVNPVPITTAHHGADVLEVEIDEVTRQPVPLRFPWLSRLSQSFESTAAQNDSTFATTPILGEQVDELV